MAEQRVKGQEIEFTFTDSNGNDVEFDNIESLEFTINMEILTKDYIGQTTSSHDDIYNDTTGSITFDTSNTKWLALLDLIQQRAQRRLPASSKFSASVSFEYPNGELGRITFPNLFFGPVGCTVGGRKENASLKMDWACATIRKLF